MRLSTDSDTPKRLSAAARRETIEQAGAAVFAERGYHGAAMAEIARRSGVSPPVVYDHFASKQALHRRLLERHFAELRGVWAEHLAAAGSSEARMAAVFDAWFGYVEVHPYAGRMLFRETTGDPEIEAIHREIAGASRAELLGVLAREPAAAAIAGDPLALELLWEAIRGVLQSLALWWVDHPEVPRARLVATAMRTLWVGLQPR